MLYSSLKQQMFEGNRKKSCDYDALIMNLWCYFNITLLLTLLPEVCDGQTKAHAPSPYNHSCKQEALSNAPTHRSQILPKWTWHQMLHICRLWLEWCSRHSNEMYGTSIGGSPKTIVKETKCGYCLTRTLILVPWRQKVSSESMSWPSRRYLETQI